MVKKRILNEHVFEQISKLSFGKDRVMVEIYLFVYLNKSLTNIYLFIKAVEIYI